MSFYETDFASVHAAVIAQDHGRSVSYRRANGAPVTITAVPRRQIYDVLNADGTAGTQVESWDWEITAADLDYEPIVGDLIRETIGGEVRAYVLFEIGTKPCCEWLDTVGLLKLVHSRRVE